MPKFTFPTNDHRRFKNRKSEGKFPVKVRRKREQCAPWGVESKHINIENPFPEKAETPSPRLADRCCNCTCRRRIHNIKNLILRPPNTFERKIRNNRCVGAVGTPTEKDFLHSDNNKTNFASQSNKVCRRSRHLKSYESFRLDWMCVVKLENLEKEKRN